MRIRHRTLALDIPTGIHGDTGAVMGTAVRAEVTVTFVGLKTGLFLGDAAPIACGGGVPFADLDIPADYRDGRRAGLPSDRGGRRA